MSFRGEGMWRCIIQNFTAKYRFFYTKIQISLKKIMAGLPWHQNDLIVFTVPLKLTKLSYITYMLFDYKYFTIQLKV